jgi:hypothetical protein
MSTKPAFQGAGSDPGGSAAQCNDGVKHEMSAPAHRSQIVLTFFWIALGLFVIILSYGLGIGGLSNPGPGLMPFALGCFLCIVSLYFLCEIVLKQGSRDKDVREKKDRTHFGKLGLVLAALFAYPLLLEPLGFLITSFSVLFVLFRSMSNRWFTVLLGSLFTALISYFLFTFLGVQLPKGILKGLS